MKNSKTFIYIINIVYLCIKQNTTHIQRMPNKLHMLYGTTLWVGALHDII